MRSWIVGASIGVLCAITLGAAPTIPSDPIGVYALVDRVVMEPDTIAPRRIQLWGTFVIQDSPSWYRFGKGYLYYELPEHNTRAAISEWFDIRGAVGREQVIGFGARFLANGRLRLERDDVGDPDPYPIASGLYRVGSENYWVRKIHEVRPVPNTPALLSPRDSTTVAAGVVRLVARTLFDTTARYVFEIEEVGGAKETSDTLAAGKGQTTWSPKMEVRPEREYEWRVWAFSSALSSAPATARFRVTRD